jgi:hypothetical protein
MLSSILGQLWRKAAFIHLLVIHFAAVGAAASFHKYQRHAGWIFFRKLIAGKHRPI